MWESPGLGVWSLRELVGHTSTAALSGVLTTLGKPAQTIVIASPEAYYAIGRTLDPWGLHRQGSFTDPFGHRWSVGDRTPLERFPRK
jgi:hypothetical protein